MTSKFYDTDCDYAGGVLDEVALEGLDGITIEGLWLRLSERANFPITIDNNSKRFIWNVVKACRSINMYELPEERKPLVIFDRYKYVDLELGIVLEPKEQPENIYPHAPVNDEIKKIRGSCQFYSSRIKVSREARSLTLDAAVSRWGNKLVLVASQSARNISLMGLNYNPSLELTLMQFCVLERIGRSRCLGEVTQGKVSLQVMGEEPKALFYHRKYLSRHKLIVKQVHHQKSGGQNCSGSLLHLPRFHTERKPKALFLTEKVIEILKKRPGCTAEYEEIRQELGLADSLKKLFKTFEFQRFVKTDLRLPYRELYPNARTSEWKHKGSDKERLIRVVKLINPDINIRDVWVVKDEDIDDEEDGESGLLDTSMQCLDQPVLRQAYIVIEDAGPNGYSQMELSVHMGLTKLQARTVCRNLVKRGLVSTFMNDVGRQRVSRFMSKKFLKEGLLSVQFNREKKKMLALVNSKSKKGSSKKRPKSDGPAPAPLSKKQKLDPGRKHGTEPVPSSSSSGRLIVLKPDKLRSKLEAERAVGNSRVLVSGLSSTVSTTEHITDAFNESSEHSVQTPQLEHSYKLQTTLPVDMDVAEAQEVCVPRSAESSEPACPTTEDGNANQPRIASPSTLAEPSSDHGIETEVIEVTRGLQGIKDYSCGFTEELQRSGPQHKDGLGITYRLLKRANLVLNCVNQTKVIDDMQKLMKMINEVEGKEGYNVKIDKKSLLRLLIKLSKDGHLKIIKVVLKGAGKVKALSFVCLPDITIEHTVIQSTIEQAKMKFFIPNKDKVVKLTLEAAKAKEEAARARKEAAKVKLEAAKAKEEARGDKSSGFKGTLGSVVPGGKKLEFHYDTTVGKKYGYCPKFLRMQVMHQFLFYLIYGYEGVDDLNKVDVVNKMRERGVDISNKVLKEMSQVYVDEVHWKMFIPPLPVHADWPEGWGLMCDIILRLPLSIFVKLFKVCYVVDGMEEYLSHPIRQHYLVKHLPSNMQNILMVARKYIFSIHEVLQRLCFIGLLQFGPQRLKEKDQVFVFVNRHASLLDTTTSRPGYHQVSEDIEYRQLRYTFNTLSDVEKYWYKMWNICIHTNLGGRICMTGKDIILEVLPNKSSMIEVMKPRQPDEAYRRDDGTIPGDKRGAAGLDSAIFSHLKRNWNWTNAHSTMPQNKEPVGRKVDQRNARLANLKNEPLKFDMSAKIVPKKTSDTRNVTYVKKKVKKNVPKKPNPPKVPQVVTRRIAKSKNFVRRILPSKARPRHRPYYDDVDRRALRLMSKLRVEWSPAEDSLLLLCKVAAMYICPNPHKQLVTFQMIRDYLHHTNQGYTNKTSRACQRRILYMLKNPQTAHSVALHLEEVKQDVSIADKFKERLHELNLSSEYNAELDKKVYSMFSELVNILHNKFNHMKNRLERITSCIPDTLEEFCAEYDVVYPSPTVKRKGRFQDVKNIVDIHCAVVNTIIHSSLCCVLDKTSWTYQLFRIYQQYPDNLLRSAMAKIRLDQMVSLKKSYVRVFPRRGNMLPVSSMPYQLSISYNHLMQTKYQYEIFHQCYLEIRRLCSWFQQNRDKEAAGMECLVVNGGGAAALVELLTRSQVTFETEIPEQVIILDPRVSEKDETYARIVQRYRDILRNCKAANDPVTSSLLFKQSLAGGTPNKKGPDSNLLALFSPRDQDDCEEIELVEEADSVLEGGDLLVSSNQQTALARTASRIALYMMREELGDSMVGEKQHAHDFFVVNSCQVRCKLCPPHSIRSEDVSGGTESINVEWEEHVFPVSQEDIDIIVSEIKSQLVVPDCSPTEDDVEQLFLEEEASDLDWQQAQHIIEAIRIKKEVGCTMKELREQFQEAATGVMPLARMLNLLTRSRIILRVGVTTVHYVHAKYSRPWLVNSWRLPRSNREKMMYTEMCINKERVRKRTEPDMDKDGETSGQPSKKRKVSENLDSSVNKNIAAESADCTAKVADKLERVETDVKTGKDDSEHDAGQKAEGDRAGASVQVTEDSALPSDKAADTDSTKSPTASTSEIKLDSKINKIKSKKWMKVLGNKRTVERVAQQLGQFSGSKNVRVAIRPWVRVDGSLNRRVLDRMLGSVLGHTMYQPGHSMKEVADRFSPALQPFQVRELIEILQKLGCVKLNVVKQSWKTTLFSKPSRISIEDADGTEDEASIIVEPQADAVLRLSRFIGEKSYGNDFLEFEYR